MYKHTSVEMEEWLRKNHNECVTIVSVTSEHANMYCKYVCPFSIPTITTIAFTIILYMKKIGHISFFLVNIKTWEKLSCQKERYS